MTISESNPQGGGEEVLQRLAVLEQTGASLSAGSGDGSVSSGNDGLAGRGAHTEHRRRKRHKRQCKQRDALSVARVPVSDFEGGSESSGRCRGAAISACRHSLVHQSSSCEYVVGISVMYLRHKDL